MKGKLPTTLKEAIVYFSDLEIATDFVCDIRWPNGVECPTCGSKQVSYLSTRRIWKCKNDHPKRQFTVKVGTIFQDSPLGLDKWLPAVWLVTNCNSGISSYELSRDLGVTQKSAWFMLHRVRLAMLAQSFESWTAKLKSMRRSSVEESETCTGAHALALIPRMEKTARKRNLRIASRR